MLYVRGHPWDYDHWSSLGNDGWSYEEVLPYFIKSECNERLQDEYHGNSGPLNVAELRHAILLQDSLLKLQQNIILQMMISMERIKKE